MTPDFFSGLKHTVNFLIVRHGQSEGNAAKILQGRGEYPLSETGRSQALTRSLAFKTALADVVLDRLARMPALDVLNLTVSDRILLTINALNLHHDDVRGFVDHPPHRVGGFDVSVSGLL